MRSHQIGAVVISLQLIGMWLFLGGCQPRTNGESPWDVPAAKVDAMNDGELCAWFIRVRDTHRGFASEKAILSSLSPATRKRIVSGWKTWPRESSPDLESVTEAITIADAQSRTEALLQFSREIDSGNRLPDHAAFLLVAGFDTLPVGKLFMSLRWKTAAVSAYEGWFSLTSDIPVPIVEILRSINDVDCPGREEFDVVIAMSGFAAGSSVTDERIRQMYSRLSLYGQKDLVFLYGPNMLRPGSMVPAEIGPCFYTATQEWTDHCFQLEMGQFQRMREAGGPRVAALTERKRFSDYAALMGYRPWTDFDDRDRMCWFVQELIGQGKCGPDNEFLRTILPAGFKDKGVDFSDPEALRTLLVSPLCENTEALAVCNDFEYYLALWMGFRAQGFSLGDTIWDFAILCFSRPASEVMKIALEKKNGEGHPESKGGAR